MKAKLTIITAFLVVTLALALAVGTYAAKPTMQDAVTPGGTTVSIPENAKEIAEGVFDLGTALDVDGSEVQGYAILRYKDGFHHRPGHDGGPGNGGGGGGDTDTSSCYTFLAKDAYWKTNEPYQLDETNNQGISAAEVFNIINTALHKWEDAADGSVDGNSINILGDRESSTADFIADTDSPDGENEVYFGDVDSEGAIAVTIVWGRFGGPPFNRELVEWDQVYDQVDFDWSTTGEAGKMDLDNIVTHEHGHAFGMGHPSDSCTEETMFRFATEEETKKQTLHDGDIAGIKDLYN